MAPKVQIARKLKNSYDISYGRLSYNATLGERHLPSLQDLWLKGVLTVARWIHMCDEGRLGCSAVSVMYPPQPQ